MARKSKSSDDSIKSADTGQALQIDLTAITTEPWTQAEIESQYLAAFQVGRLLNCYDWLVARHEWYSLITPLSEIEYVIRRLAALSHTITISEPLDDFRDCIYETHRAWQEWLQSRERRLEMLNDDPDQYCESFDVTLSSRSDEIREAFAGAMGSRGKILLKLGRRVDQGLRPMQFERSRFTKLFDEEKVDPSDLSTDPLWAGDIEGLSKQLGFSAGSATDTVKNVLAKVAAVDHLVREHFLTSAGSQSGSTETEWRLGYLGLQVAKDRYEVKRHECEPVCLSRLLWGLFLALEANQDRYLPAHEVGKVWLVWGRAAKVRRPTITSSLKELKNKLVSLGIDIASRRNKGWRLELASDKSKAG